MIGIDNENFDELILKFYDIKEELNQSFNTINSLIDDISSNYDCPSGKELVHRAHMLSDSNFTSILENFDSYIRDLKSARENMDLFDSKLSAQIVEEKGANIA